MNNFKVSICMITYNHEKFIAQAIESVLMQITNFEYQLVIGEDCSTDKTREICKYYKEKFPEKIFLRLPEKNLGSMPNSLENLKFCYQGFKYTAMCEGDDYWNDSNKLQMQIDYLESNNDCGLVYTDAKIFNVQENIFEKTQPKYFHRKDDVIRELLISKYIHFPTIVVRTSLLIEIMKVLGPELIGKIIGDTRLILEFAQNSRIGYLPKETTVYRIVEGSASHPTTINNFILAMKDTYLARKTFVLRYNLNKNLLAIPVCNLNKGLINKAFINKNYCQSLKILSNLNIGDTINYVDYQTFRIKITFKIFAKFLLVLTGLVHLKKLLLK